MSQYQADGAEYMADEYEYEYEMEDVDDEMDDEFRGREIGGSESDADEYDHSVCFSTLMFDEIAHTHGIGVECASLWCVYIYVMFRQKKKFSSYFMLV